MRITNQQPRDTIFARIGRNPVRFVLILLPLCFIALTGLLTSVILSINLTKTIKEWMFDHGYQPIQTFSLGQVFDLPANLISSRMGYPSVPELTFDIKFKHMQKLEKKRTEALLASQLIQGADDLVPGQIRIENRSIPVKLRLKGDLTDHIEKGRWAFRVHVKGNDQVLGMRRFSIHHPQGRDYHLEPLYFDLLKHEGVLTPRYGFVNVTLNGEALGLMAIEEHFSKELLENRQRKESVILKFDESLVWAARDGTAIYGKPYGFWGVFDNVANTTIRPFRESKVSESASLTRDRRLATGLLRGFISGKLPASEVFDARLLGKFIAIAEAWGSFHSLNWNNQRFYFNPITAKLEPIGYDGWTGHPIKARLLVERRDPIVRWWLNDPEVWNSYVQTLKRLAQGFRGSAIEKILLENQKSYLSILHRNYPLAGPFDFETIPDRAGKLLDAIDTSKGQPYPRYPKYLHAYEIKHDKEYYVELANAIPYPLEVASLQWVDGEGNVTGTLETIDKVSFPLVLPATEKEAIPNFQRVYFRPPTQLQHDNQKIQVSFRIHDNPRIYTDRALPYFPTLDSSPLPLNSVHSLLSQYPFFTWDPKEQALTIKSGEWAIDRTIALPETVSLTVEPGSLLRFSEDAAFITRGPTYFKGRLDAPIILTGQKGNGEGVEGTWKGVAVLQADTPSEWSYVTVSNTTGVSHGNWELPGGVTFYQSEANLDHCKFSGNRSEDAINIVRTNFNMSHVEITDTVSDALDSDFSQGMINNSLFKHVGHGGGGDAIDVSGSHVHVIETRITDTRDKALSVGERSQLKADNLSIDNVYVGAASKDGSKLTISSSKFHNVTFTALMAYIKKPEYGPATISATGLDITSTSSKAIAQTNNLIEIDGEQTPTQSLNIEALYATTMKHGNKR